MVISIACRNALALSGFCCHENLPEFELQAKQAHEIGCNLTLCYLPPFTDDRNFNDLFIQTSDQLREVKPILQNYGIKIGFEFIGLTETRRSTHFINGGYKL